MTLFLNIKTYKHSASKKMIYQNYVSHDTYFKFLDNLLIVANQCNTEIEYQKKIQDEISKNKTTELAYASYSLATVVGKINECTQDKLVIYAAARKTGPGAEEIANVYLKEWQKELDDMMAIEFDSLQSDSVNILNSKINAAVNRIKWPEFEDPETVYETITEGMKHVLSKEAAYLKLNIRPFHAMPCHVFPLIDTPSLVPHQEFLIDKYAYLQKGLSFTEKRRTTLSNQEVQVLLKRFPYLEFLDLSNCPNLSSNCLEEGHLNLQKIDLRGTNIKNSEIPMPLFPKLGQKNILVDKRRVTFDASVAQP